MNQETSPAAKWAEQHVGVVLDWRGQTMEIASAAHGKVTLKADDGTRRIVEAASALRAYLAEFGGMR